jgi:hypothetical protein
MSLYYSAGDFFILETSFGGGFEYPNFVRKHVALQAVVDVDISGLMERYGEWLVRTGRPAAALLIEHHFGKGYSDNVDGDGFIAWMAAQGKVKILTSNVVKVAVEAYEGGDVRVSADDGLGAAWKRVMDDPAPRTEQVAWREVGEAGSPAHPQSDTPFEVVAVSINPAVKRSLNLGCDLATAVAAQVVEQQFVSRPDWQDQQSYAVVAVQEDGEEDRSRTIRIEVSQPAAYEGIYSVQMTRYVRKGVESFGFHATRQRPSSLEANQLSLLVLSGSILPADVHNIYDIHSTRCPLVLYASERGQFQELLERADRQSEVVRSKVTGELGLMVRESLSDYAIEDLHGLPSYLKLRQEMKIPVHIIENWPVVSGKHVGAFVSATRISELADVAREIVELNDEIAQRPNACRR